MKKIILTALSASVLLSGVSSASAESNYSTEKQYDSSNMRMEYYNKYKGKGYDVTPLKYYLDGTKTTDSQFWEALKQVQNNHEVPDRRAYIEKLKKYGYDVSGFTESIIYDSGKFWEMVKMIESSGKKMTTEVKKEEEKKIEVKQVMPVKKEEEKKQEEKKIQTSYKLTTAQSENLKKIMKARIAKIAPTEKDAILAKLETTLVKQIASAQSKNAKILAARYEVLLSVVREEMTEVNDETLIESLFQ